MTHQASRHIAPARKIHPDLSVPLSVILLSTGTGKRMKSYGPKSLLEINNGVTILDSQLRSIWIAFPNADVIVITGFQYEKFIPFKKMYPVRLVNNPLYDETNMVYSISLGLQTIIGDRILIIQEGIVFNHHTIHNIDNDLSQIVVDVNEEMPDDSVGLVHNNNKVTNLSFGLDVKWSQIVYLTGYELQLLDTIAYDAMSSRHLFLYEAINRIINRNGKFITRSNPLQTVKEIDTAKDIEAVRHISMRE